MTFSTRQHIAYMLSVLYAIAGLSVCLSVTWPRLTVDCPCGPFKHALS